MTTEKQQPDWEKKFDRIFVDENVWQGEDEYTKKVPIGNIKSFIEQTLKEEREEIVRAIFSGQTVEYKGKFFKISDQDAYNFIQWEQSHLPGRPLNFERE